MAAKKKVAPAAAVEVSEKVTLESIVLDTPAKQEYMRVIEAYRKQNPKKFVHKEEAFIKKLLSL